MLRRSLASIARRPLARCVSTKAAASIELPKFLVTTVAPDNSPGRNKEGLYEGLYEFDTTSEGSTGEQPVFLLDVKYEGKSVNTDLDNDKGQGKFEGTAVTQVNSYFLPRTTRNLLGPAWLFYRTLLVP